MAGAYRLGRRAPACTECGTPFEPGQVIVTAIYEAEEEAQPAGPGTGFSRCDLCEGCFASVRPAYSHWRARQPVPPSGTGKLDYDLALDFFRRLLREADPAREALAYALALLLGRKKRVRIRRTQPLPEGTLLELTVPGDEEDESVRIRAPHIDAELEKALQAELAKLFGFSGSAADESSGNDLA